MQLERYQPCIEALKACIAACEHCAQACKEENSPLHMQRCIQLDTDCTDYCKLTLSFVQRESAFTELVLEDCAEVCKLCAEACLEHDADHCQQCAQACQACVDACLLATIH